MPIPDLRGVAIASLGDSTVTDAHDALVLVAASPLVEQAAVLGAMGRDAVQAALRADAALGRAGPRPPVVLAAPDAPGGRLVIALMSGLTLDTDDVRLVAEATAAGVARAVDAGATRPLLVVSLGSGASKARFARAVEVATLAALASQWAPLEAREAEKAPKTATSIGVSGLSEARARDIAAIEAGRALCRDITGTEPERMAPRRIAELCESAFHGTGAMVSVEHDISGYPLIAAVARASLGVERHRPCVVRLEVRPEGEIRSTIVLAGKGVAYDTGGADLKTDGAMAGMSRDKGGAGAVAGFLRAAAALQVPGVRVVGLLGLVRNSIGEDAYVSDEIIRARSGVRVRIGNTDAEGRLVLADLLSAAKEITAGEPDPVILSLATLTGHVYRAFGPYVGILGNAPARDKGHIDALDRLGEQWGEPMERSRPRREDYAFVAARSSAEDVVSSNRLPSVSTPRGHQFPFAFLDIAAGLVGNATPFMHLDLAGAAIDPPDWQFGKPTASPITTLAAYLTYGAGD
jgi:leucyl aminopeptidase